VCLYPPEGYTADFRKLEEWLRMEREKEDPALKQVKILKCEKCGEEYLFDSTSRICPECSGVLKTETVVR
jgi:hypothetical protein